MPRKTYIGFDIGATHTRAVVWRSGKTVRIIKIKTPRTKNNFSVEIRDLLNAIVPKGKAAVGISIAGVLQGGVLKFSPNKKALSGLNLRKIVPARFSLTVDNDARAFAYGEYKKGAGKGVRRLLAFTIGTGVGRAVVLGGKIKKVKSFEQAEGWEREYQRLRVKGKNIRLAEFLTERLQVIINRYHPDQIVIGGGVALDHHKRFFKILAQVLRSKNPHVNISAAALGDLGAAYGMMFR